MGDVTKVSGFYQDITGIWSAFSLPPETQWLMNVDASPDLLQSATLQSCTYLNLTRFLLAGTDGKPIRVLTADSSLIVLMNTFVFTVMLPLTMTKGQ